MKELPRPLPHLPPVPTSDQLEPDEELINKLRTEFSHKLVAEELLKIVKELCAAIGVEVNTQIARIDKHHKVDVPTVMSGIPRLSAAVAAIYAGSAVNPLHVIEEQQNVTKQPRPEADREAPPRIDKG